MTISIKTTLYIYFCTTWIFPKDSFLPTPFLNSWNEYLQRGTILVPVDRFYIYNFAFKLHMCSGILKLKVCDPPDLTYTLVMLLLLSMYLGISLHCPLSYYNHTLIIIFKCTSFREFAPISCSLVDPAFDSFSLPRLWVGHSPGVPTFSYWQVLPFQDHFKKRFLSLSLHIFNFTFWNYSSSRRCLINSNFI